MSRFCENVFREIKDIEFLWKQDGEFGNCVQLDWDKKDITDEHLRIIASSFVDVFMTLRLRAYVEQLLSEVYYFENETEVNRILDVSHWILFSDDAESRILRKTFNVYEALYDQFLLMLQPGSNIHFDSIVQFRFSGIKELLIEHIGLAIEEYKREEEHQAYVQMLREYVTTLEIKTPEIHVVQGSTFQFFNEFGKELVRFELRTVMHEAPLYLVGLDVEEFNLSPLIALAPKRIYIYGDDPTDPKTVTIMNVFQERVTFCPMYRFPFMHEKEK